MGKEFTITIKTDEGDEQEIELPTKKEVCFRCHGEGTHVNPNVDGHGISAEEWANDWEEEEREAYFSGRYDVTCEECNGLRVVDVVDEEALSPTERKAYEDWCDSEAAYRAECAAERRFGC